MKIDLKATDIRLANTRVEDIGQIIEFEKSNNQFIGSYSKEHHARLVNDQNCLHLSVRTLRDDQLVGHVILLGLMSEHKVLEFKRIAISAKGKGYGRQTIQLIKKICFELLKFHRLWLDVFDDNSRAFRLYESEGFVQEALLRENIKTDKGSRSLRIYSILKPEYIKSNRI